MDQSFSFDYPYTYSLLIQEFEAVKNNEQVKWQGSSMHDVNKMCKNTTIIYRA